MSLAARQPEVFVGKTLVFATGERVGPVMDLRRRLQDQELYLVVDATEFFNDPTEYAVAVSDLESMETDTLVIPEAPGMHLRGIEYYAEDYTAPGAIMPEENSQADEQ